MEFKDKLKDLRKSRSLSQQALADAIHVSRSAVAKWENGLGLPCDESYDALCEYFGVTRDSLKTDQPETLIVEKNKHIRRLAKILGTCVVLLLALFVLFALSIPYVNDRIADGVEDRLLTLPLPEDAELVDSLSAAGKFTGNGNGMQYFGAILIKSDLTEEEVEEHYAKFRNGSADDCAVRLQEGQRIEFLHLSALEFDAELSEEEQYYLISAWGDGIGIYEELDLRGH